MKDPVEVEAMKVARNEVKDMIRNAGGKVWHYDSNEITDAAKQLLASRGNNIREKAWESVARRVYAFDWEGPITNPIPSHAECQAADQYVQRFAYRALSGKLGWRYPRVVRNYLMAMVDHHEGAWETEDMLQRLGCYPSWVR